MVASTVAEQLESASWIRKMFEEGARLKAGRGAENVCDFTLGNPLELPPAAVSGAFARIAAENRYHGYMPNAGYPEVRKKVAAQLKRRTGLDFTANHILLMGGAASGLNTILKAIINPGDEVIVPVPFFAEYQFYISNCGARMKRVETRDDFQLEVGAIEGALSPKTKAIILNSPNNPTGAVYPESTLLELEELLVRQPRPIMVISDEPYRELVYDGATVPEVPSCITHSAVCFSWSKSFALAGERIGYIALSPRLDEIDSLIGACTFTSRTLGFVNAPAVWQWVVGETLDEPMNTEPYRLRVERMCAALKRIGYELQFPQGAFYLFPKTPIADDVEFVKLLQRDGVLAVPGRGFGRAGHIRLSMTVADEVVERSIPAFKRAFDAAI